MDPKKTGTIILDARKKLNMTQKDLADKLYVSDKAVSKWERGLCFPDISVLIPLTEILKISLYDLLRGERMNKSEVEETLKDTINYSNSELKRKKKKYLTISSIIVGVIALVSLVTLVAVGKDNGISALVDKDTIYDISYYADYKTTIESAESEKIELIVMKMPLSWKERTFKIEEDTIKVNYAVSYKDVVKAYNDEEYVKLAMLDIASIMFTTVSDVETIEIRFTDNRYSITRKVLLEAYEIANFDEVVEKDKWNDLVQKKLINDEFVKDTFKLFKKGKVSKEELEINPVSEK